MEEVENPLTEFSILIRSRRSATPLMVQFSLLAAPVVVVAADFVFCYDEHVPHHFNFSFHVEAIKVSGEELSLGNYCVVII